MPDTHHIFLIPGMFGFSQLAGYDYFTHVERALVARLRANGVGCRVVVVAAPPTGSIRKRARVLAQTVRQSAGEESGPIHLIGHSTGGLDARLLASPHVDLDLPPSALEWVERLRSVTTLNTPHYGTPVAHFFSTVSGTRLLYALSLMTFTTLHFGGPPLTVFSSLVAAVGGIDEALGIDVRILDRSTDLMLRILGEQARTEVRDWLDGIRRDQGGVIQITPEAMDIFNAAAEDSPAVRYGCIATAAPSPRPMHFATKIRSPWSALSATIYATLHTLASRASTTYPIPKPNVDVASELRRALRENELQSDLNDGIVPTQSMLWGELLWSGVADHLDVVGHFDGGAAHTDWLTSGAEFDAAGFDGAMDALAKHLLNES